MLFPSHDRADTGVGCVAALLVAVAGAVLGIGLTVTRPAAQNNPKANAKAQGTRIFTVKPSWCCGQVCQDTRFFAASPAT